MKIINKLKICAVTGVLALGCASCSDMMDIDSDRVAFEENNRLDNANDSIYSVMGILSKLQAVADRCIVMGELRGDLMTTDPTFATTDLKQIEQFDVQGNNAYADKRDFYTVINNCNYAIAHMDTSIVEGISHVMLPEYAQIKTLRAWTYMQMGLIFGEVNYYTKALQNTQDLEGNTRKMGLDELTTTLIADLEPMAQVRPLNYGSVDGWNSTEFFIPTLMLLGDLYLYNNDYEKAAQAYYQLIDWKNITVGTGYANYYTSDTRSGANMSNNNAYRSEVLTRLVFDNNLRSTHSKMRHLTYSETPALLPATQFVDEMAQRNYFHTTNNTAISRYFIGDLRGCAELNNGRILPAAYGPATVGEAAQRTLITKFYNSLNGSTGDDLQNRPLTSLAIYRPSMLYLRYAEAINRLGKPSIAFATLKYGLKNASLSDTLKVDSNEVKNLPAYIDFRQSKFDGNQGTAARGCGLGTALDNRLYVIPECATREDSIEYVENCILQEMAAETCFEGNRFFDLLRVSHHRANHPQLMVDKVAAKPSVGEALRQKLLDIANWWVK